MDKPTIDFYNLHANEQAALYETADMSSMYNRLATLLKDRGKILEIGCGSGRDARALANMGFSVVATDASEGMIREAKRLSAGNVCGLSFAWLPFPISKRHALFTEQFDLVLAVAVLMHLSPQDRQSVLYQVARLLKPGGIFFCTFKNEMSHDNRLYQQILPAELIVECDNAGMKCFLQESSNDILGRVATWMTLAFRAIK